MRLTERDIQVILAVYDYRVLRRNQIEQLLFPSKNTANERLKRLYQHRFLERRFLAVEYGKGTSQALYLLAERGADLVASELGMDRGQINWRESHNQVGTIFLEHTLLVNQFRIDFTQAARQQGYRVDEWVKEEDLKAARDYVHIVVASGRRRRIAVIPDGYFVLNLGDKRGHFCLEVDRATETNKRWAQKIQAYREYTQSGQYSERFGTRSLRVLTVTTSQKRLANLKRTTEQASGGRMFWFTTFEQAQPNTLLTHPIWQVATVSDEKVLI